MHHSVFLVFVYAFGLEGLRVRGSSGPLVAQLGGSVLLPCFIESPLPLEDLQVEWRKMDSDSLVSVFLHRENRPDLQSQQFRGRVDVFPDEILKGNFSILLKNVVEEDAGGYRCQVNTSQDSNEVIMEIEDFRGLVVTGADRAVFAREGDDVVLNCSVDSHVPASEIEEVTWKRIDRDQEILVLLYQDNEIFPDSSHERYRGRVDFFSSEIPKGNFSLKLMDIQMEDKGEFVCEVHTRNMSGRTVVLLQGVGFSALQISVLVFCFVGLLLGIGFCAPVFNLLRKKVTTKKGMKIHISLILCPNICMFVAFCLWSTEGLLSEVVTCLAVSIMRPLMLMKTSSYLDQLPQFLQKVVKALAVPLYHLSVSVAACSRFFTTRIEAKAEHIDTILTVLAVVFVISAVVLAIYDPKINLTVCLEVVNAVLLGLILWGSTIPLDYANEMTFLLILLNVGILMVLTLQRHLFLGKRFGCVTITVLSIFMTAFSIFGLSIYVFFIIRLNDFVKGWKLVLEAVIFMLAWMGVIYVLRCRQGRRQGCCAQWRKKGYLCCAVIAAFLIPAYGAVCFHYIYIIMDRKDLAGILALTPLVHVLAAASSFKHPKHLPDFLHIVIYMFGAVALSAVNAIALATELILKTGKGARTVEDLRVIVLPLETVFLLAWISLQIYDSWMRFKDRAKRSFEDEKRPEPEIAPKTEEMKFLSNPD